MSDGILNLKQISQILPGIAVWKKSKDSVFIDVTYEFTRIFGFKKIEACIGLNDYDLPCKAAELAETFQRNDREVLTTGKVKKLLEIFEVANGQRKIFLTTKSPMYDNDSIIGTLGYCIDITYAFIEASYLLTKDNKRITGCNLQASFIIGLEQSNLNLSAQQLNCLFYLVRGRKPAQIAAILDVPVTEINLLIKQIMAELNCNTKDELIAFAVEQGFLTYLPETLLNPSLCKSQLKD